MIPRKPIRSRRRKPRPGRLKGADMGALRRACFERDFYHCQHAISHGRISMPCGRRVTWESGHMAHIVGRGRGGKDELSNVTTKCAECHIGIEHSYGPSGQKPVPPKDLGLIYMTPLETE
jgi:5-methylcytosine-specific restriction endonuclease McrA